jgi:hypothetical protein
VLKSRLNSLGENRSFKEKIMSTSRITRIILAFLFLMSVGNAAFAQGARRWVVLGQTTVDGQRDRDTIALGRAEGTFRSIQLRVTGAPVEFYRVVVRFGNGANEEVEVRERIPAGGQTRAIDLRGADRVINSVEFFYGKGNWRPSARPRVTLYGEKFIAPRPGPWVLLGQTTVDGQRDRDTIAIGRSEGRFHSIQLRVAGAPVEFQRVVVRYANGTSEEVEVRDYIQAGGQTRAIDLRGNERVISSVEFLYSKARWQRGARPRVSLYGR